MSVDDGNSVNEVWKDSADYKENQPRMPALEYTLSLGFYSKITHFSYVNYVECELENMIVYEIYPIQITQIGVQRFPERSTPTT